MVLIFYAIQHTTTGNLLPPGGKGIGGHTGQEATSARPPRLFMKASAAKRALTYYLQGRWKEVFNNSFGDEGGESYPEPIPRTERKKDEFRVIEVKVQVSLF